MQFEVSVSGSFDGLSEAATLTVYRLAIQEGLTNILQACTRATRAEITLERAPSMQSGLDELQLTVADDGCGMEYNARVSRFGFERHARTGRVVGRSFHAHQRAGGGAQVHGLHPGEWQRQRL